MGIFDESALKGVRARLAKIESDMSDDGWVDVEDILKEFATNLHSMSPSQKQMVFMEYSKQIVRRVILRFVDFDHLQDLFAEDIDKDLREISEGLEDKVEALVHRTYELQGLSEAEASQLVESQFKSGGNLGWQIEFLAAQLAKLKPAGKLVESAAAQPPQLRPV